MMNRSQTLLSISACNCPSNQENQNTPEYLEGIRNRLLENLSKIPPKPSVPFHTVPPDAISLESMAGPDK